MRGWLVSRTRTALSLPRLAALTTATTLSLVALGVYTAATGSGLACSAQWPLCDGGLLPRTIPSFIEWFHRLVAMVTGLLIVATAALAWRAGDRGTRLAATVALVLLPLQVVVGAVTVTLGGAIPGGYSVPTQSAHLLVALSIFTALTVATLRTNDDRLADPPAALARRALAVAGVLVLVALPFSRLFPIYPYDPAAQAAFVGVSLALHATLVATVRWLGRAGRPDARALALLADAAVLGHLLLGRDLLVYGPTVGLADAGLVLVALAAVGLGAWRLRASPTPGSHGPVTGD